MVYLNERFVTSKERKSSIGDECDCVTRVCRPAFSRAVKFILLAQSKIYLFNKFFRFRTSKMMKRSGGLHSIRIVWMKFNLFITRFALRRDEIRAAAFNVKYDRLNTFFIKSSYLEYHLFYINDFYINFIFIFYKGTRVLSSLSLGSIEMRWGGSHISMYLTLTA